MNINDFNFRSKMNFGEEYIQKKTMLYVSLILVVSSAVLGIGGGMLGASYMSDKSNKQNETSSGLNSYVQTDDKLSVVNVANIATDSVVEISTETVKTNQLMKQYISSGAGSGVIVSEDGYIITNVHVVSGANKITVTLNNKNTYEAKVVGKSSSLDIAMIKIDANGLKATSLGNSSSLNLGEEVVAIGNPLGQLGGTVTNGIISSLSRNITINGETMNLLQTNALINPGNSGGGIFNSKGEVVGIVVAKSSGSGVEGIGFAIPIDNVKPFIKEIKENGYIKGSIKTEISLVDIASEQVANMYNVKGTGVLVTKVSQNTNASKAGFKENDFILSVDSESIQTVSEFESAIKKHTAGDIVKVTVRRGSKELTLKWTLSEE